MESIIKQHHIYDTMIDGGMRVDNGGAVSPTAATDSTPHRNNSEQRQPVDANTYEPFSNNNNNTIMNNNQNGWKYGEQQHQQQHQHQPPQLLPAYINGAIAMNYVNAIATNSNVIETNGICSPPTRPMRIYQSPQQLRINPPAESGV